MAMSEKTIRTFTEELASKAPVPGGGGAAALTGALGTALADMVGSLTVGKKKYAAVEAEVYDLKAEADRLRRALLDALDADAAAFEPLSRAYGLPKETEEEKAVKAAVLEKALLAAAEPPLDIMELCMEALRLTARISEIGSRLAVSDAGCAAALLRAAMQSASLNVRINTKMLKDRNAAEELNAKTNRLLAEGLQLSDRVFEAVAESLM